MLIDANLQLYTGDSRSPFHTAAAGWLEETLNGRRRVGLPWQTIGAFVRIISHPRVTAEPLGPERAWAYVEACWMQTLCGFRRLRIARRGSCFSLGVNLVSPAIWSQTRNSLRSLSNTAWKF